MDRRKKMISKRKAKQRKVDRGIPLDRGDGSDMRVSPLSTGAKLIFKEGTAGVAGVWAPGSDSPSPLEPEDQP